MASQEMIGYYRIEAAVGQGQRAEVYRAVDMVRKRTVALKLLFSTPELNQAALRRLLDTAQQASELVHPHIAWVWEVGELDSRIFVAERFVNGPNLAASLSTEQAGSAALPLAKALAVLRDLAQALDFAHAHGWVYGDLQPQNIVLSAEHGAVLTNFGLEGIHDRKDLLFHPVSAPRQAPELWQDQPASPSSDQYTLACLLVEMLTGRALFGAHSHEEIPDQQANLRLAEAGLPWQVIPALERALSPDPARRFPSLTAFAEAPEVYAAHVEARPDKLAQYQAQETARQQAEAVARQQAIETARLAALQQARQEIEFQAHRTVESAAPTSLILAPAMTTPAVVTSPVAAKSDAELSLGHRSRKPGRRRTWGLWLAALIIIGLSLIIVFGGWIGPIMPSSSPTPTLTQTQSPLPSSFTPSSTATRLPTSTLTPTGTATATPTRTLTPTTNAPTVIPGASDTPTQTPLPSPGSSPSPTTVKPDAVDAPVARNTPPRPPKP